VAGQYVAPVGRRSYLRSERALRPALGYLCGLGVVPAAAAARFAAYLAHE
jgi:hypothetical protein